MKTLIKYGREWKANQSKLKENLPKSYYDFLESYYTSWLSNIVKSYIDLHQDAWLLDADTEEKQLDELERLISVNDHLLDHEFLEKCLVRGD